MSQGVVEKILRLPVAERFAVAEAIWDSVADSAVAQGITPRRLAVSALRTQLEQQGAILRGPTA